MSGTTQPTGAPALSEAGDALEDPRLMQAVHEYLAELEKGNRPDRQEFLQRYPDIAGSLKQCLEGLDLVHHIADKEKSSVSRQSEPARSLEPGATQPIGDFRIVREIGRGGMGVVYEAVQLSLDRRVALKVLPFAATFDSKLLGRFRNEAQAAGQLHHTNIVPVYAVGSERGVHYYAMQLIDGQSLAAVIGTLARNAGATRSRPTAVASTAPHAAQLDADTPPAQESVYSRTLTTQRSTKQSEFFRTAARLIVQAAEALEHAHQFGIIHRDIKPANLLLDERGRLWVTDFGLALFRVDAGLTQTGDTPGTLRYMSPEQASGQRPLLDHRTDVYSLGATLYELVTLEPIFLGQTRLELLHQILHEEPRAPRLLEKSLPVELETIILKAISKSPADRYASAQDLANDLRRFLEDRPILAKRPGVVDRARKWSRRHPTVVWAGMLLLLVCVVGLLVSNWMIGKEQAKTALALEGEKARAEEARERAIEARDRAMEARRALDKFVEVSEEELGDIPFAQTVRRRLLETALFYYQDFLETHGRDPSAQAELEAGRERVRRILDELATIQGAILFGLATSEPAVQNDLVLSKAQRDKLKALADRAPEQLMRFPRERGQSEERRQQTYQILKAQETELANILDATQQRRLKQIELQVLGPRVFHDLIGIDSLKLTSDQRRRIRDIREESMPLMMKGDGPPPDKKGGPGGEKKDGPGPGPKFKIERKAEMEKILTVLTDEQKRQWQELIGATFEGRLERAHGLFGPRGFGPPMKGGYKGPP